MPMLPAMAVIKVRAFLVSRFLPLRKNAVITDIEECFSLYAAARAAAFAAFLRSCSVRGLPPEGRAAIRRSDSRCAA